MRQPGNIVKVFITFPKAFWVGCGNDNGDGSGTSTPAPPGDGNEFPGYTNWIGPNYAIDTNPHRWPQEAYNLAAFAPPHSHPTLLFYIYGDCSASLTTLVHGRTTRERYHALYNFFHPYFSRLPHYDDGSPDCKPVAILSTEWQKDELAGYGSYCNFQVAIEDADSDVKAIRHGMPDRRLWLAGEHTAPFEECGTVTGAYLSGEAVAHRILGVYGTKVADKEDAVNASC